MEEKPITDVQKQGLLDAINEALHKAETYRDKAGRSENGRHLATIATDLRKVRALLTVEVVAVVTE